MTKDQEQELRERTLQVKDESHLRRLGVDVNNLLLRQHYFEVREHWVKLAGNGYMQLALIIGIAQRWHAGEFKSTASEPASPPAQQEPPKRKRGRPPKAAKPVGV